MNKTSARAYSTLLASARQVVSADDAKALDQKLIEILRKACEACDSEEAPPGRHTSIPTVGGLYWYHSAEAAPEPVLIDRERYGDRFKAFNNREQGWVRRGEFFTGPIVPPADR